jgi:quercetin dioxygenase-like cupin family protein
MEACFLRGAEQGWEDLGGGVQRQILGHDDALMMVRVRFEPGAVGAIHQHPHRQVTHVDAGRFEVEIGGVRQILEAGDSFFVPPNVPHGVTALEEGTLLDVFAPARADFLSGETER